jgi:Ca2+-binding EF-hand superfamily protein
LEGVLDSKEFMALLRSTNLNLSKTAIRRIMEEADVNDDGLIEYREFVPVMIDIIETSNKILDGISEKQEAEAAAWEAAQAFILEGKQSPLLVALV